MRIGVYPVQQNDIWRVFEQIPQPWLQTLLEAKNHLIVLRHGRPPYRVVLGAPHQAPAGVWRICEERLDDQGRIKDRNADDNVASLALVAFSRLRGLDVPCKVVIMAHATRQDPNKVLTSPYCREIFSEAMDLLFECHAAGGRRRLDLELSAGSNPLSHPVRFGQALATALAYRYDLGVQIRSGQSDALILQTGGATTSGWLQLPATKTTSLIEAGRCGVEALHLETKPRFRIVRGQPHAVSPDGVILGRAVAEVIASY